jgi:hypothetical protein
LKFGAAEKREIAGAKNQPQAGEKKMWHVPQLEG